MKDVCWKYNLNCYIISVMIFEWAMLVDLFVATITNHTDGYFIYHYVHIK